MGKKYLDVKKDSLEESILDIWQTAAEETGTKMDGRTRGYKSHRSKLEDRRTKREDKKAVGEKSSNKKEGLDEARQLKDPKKEMLVVKGGKVVAIDKKDAKEYLNKGWTVAESIENSVLRIWQTAADEMKVEEKKSYEIGTDDYREYLERLTPGETIKEGTKEEYQKFFNAAMKKFKIDSPADLKSDEEKKKFFDYIDKNYTGEKDEELTQLAREFKISSMKEAIAKVWNFSEKVQYVEYKFKNENDAKKAKAYFDKQQMMSFELNDDNISGGELMVDAGKNDMTKHHKEIMKMLKPKVMTQEKVGDNKTLTGKKAAVIEIDPESDLENRKKKKSGNPDH